MLHRKDGGGRDCTDQIETRVDVSRERIDQQLHSGTPTPDAIAHITGNTARREVKLEGKGPIQSYRAELQVSGSDVDLATVARMASRSLGMPTAGLSVPSKKEAKFVLPESNAGAQFVPLEAFLFDADVEEMSKLVMTGLNLLASDKAGARSKSQSHADDSPGLLDSILEGAVLGLLISAAIAGLMTRGIAFGIACAAVFGTLAAASFLTSLMNRFKEARAAGVGNSISVFRTAVLETVGRAQIDEAITDHSLLTGRR